MQASSGLPVGVGVGAAAAGGSLAALRLELPAFGAALDRQRSRALGLLRRIVECAEPGAGDEVTDDIVDGGGGGAAVEFLDRLRESAETAIDEARGQHSSQQVAVLQGQLGGGVSSGRGGRGGGGAGGAFRRAPVAKAMAKPQERFSDAVDNARDTPFIPRGGTPVAASRPPAYRAMQLAPALPPAAFAPLDDVECTYIETPAQLMDMLDYLEGTGAGGSGVDDAAIRLPRDAVTGAAPVAELAIDLEAHSLRSFAGFCCLVQLSTRRRDFLVDALALRADLRLLNRVTAHPAIVKVLHGCDSDVLWLQRDFGVSLVNVFDTGQAARVLGYPSFGLAHLLSHFAGVTANKEYQTADWRERPLPAEMLKYAREDTHYLLPIYDRLKNELIDGSAATTAVPALEASPAAAGPARAAGSEPPALLDAPNLLAAVLARSAEKAAAVYTKEVFSRRGYRRLMVKLGLKPTAAPAGSHGGDGGEEEGPGRDGGGEDDDASDGAPASPRTRVFAALFDWRDATARAEDESTHYVLPNRLLGRLAEAAPSNVDQLVRACNPMPPLVRARAGDVVAVVNRAVAPAAAVSSGAGAGSAAAAAGAATAGAKRARTPAAAADGAAAGGSKRVRGSTAGAAAAAAVVASAASPAGGGVSHDVPPPPPGGWLALPRLDGVRITRCEAVVLAGGRAPPAVGSAAAAFDAEDDVGQLPSRHVSARRGRTSAPQVFDDEDDVGGGGSATDGGRGDGDAATAAAVGAVVQKMRRASLLALLGVQPQPREAEAAASGRGDAAPITAVADAAAAAPLAAPQRGVAAGVEAPANPALLASVAASGDYRDADILSLSQRFNKRKLQPPAAAVASPPRAANARGAEFDDVVIDRRDEDTHGDAAAAAAAPAPAAVPAPPARRVGDGAAAARPPELAPFNYGDGAELHVREAIDVARRALEQPQRQRGRGGRGGRGNPYVLRGRK